MPDQSDDHWKTGDFHIDDENFSEQEPELDKWQILDAHIGAAAISDNPTVIDALQTLCLLVRMVEPEKLETNLSIEKSFSGKDFVTRLDRIEAHQIVDEVLTQRYVSGIIALGNLMNVVRREKRKKD
jgi:hypothetical protein